MRGRKAIPTGIKDIEGNRGHRTVNENEPKPPVRRPSCPRQLSAIAKWEWRRIVPLLEGLGILGEIDRSALAAYCQAFGRWIEAEQHLEKTSLVIMTKSGNVIENPYYSISKRERELMYKFAIEFGLTPASRTRIDVAAAFKFARVPAKAADGTAINPESFFTTTPPLDTERPN